MARRLRTGRSVPPKEPLGVAIPIILPRWRQLKNWHTPAITRGARLLDVLELEPPTNLNLVELRRPAIKPGGRVRMETRRGSPELSARSEEAVQERVVRIPFCSNEAVANLLTNPALGSPLRDTRIRVHHNQVLGTGLRRSRGIGLARVGSENFFCFFEVFRPIRIEEGVHRFGGEVDHRQVIARGPGIDLAQPRRHGRVQIVGARDRP